MSSLLRTTAAAAAIAALGAGFAGTAFAAPELPTGPGVDKLGSVPAKPDLTSAVPTDATELPPQFNVEAPHVNTAAPATPDASSSDGVGDVSGTSTDAGSFTRKNDVGALAALDTAKSMADMARGTSAPTTEGNSLG